MVSWSSSPSRPVPPCPPRLPALLHAWFLHPPQVEILVTIFIAYLVTISHSFPFIKDNQEIAFKHFQIQSPIWDQVAPTAFNFQIQKIYFWKMTRKKAYSHFRHNATIGIWKWRTLLWGCPVCCRRLAAFLASSPLDIPQVMTTKMSPDRLISLAGEWQNSPSWKQKSLKKLQPIHCYFLFIIHLSSMILWNALSVSPHPSTNL